MKDEERGVGPGAVLVLIQTRKAVLLDKSFALSTLGSHGEICLR